MEEKQVIKVHNYEHQSFQNVFIFMRVYVNPYISINIFTLYQEK